MPAVRVEIIRILDYAAPGWVQCVLQDAAGREWTFEEVKEPFVATKSSDIYPQPGAVDCEIIRQWTDEQGRTRCLIDTDGPYGVTALDGCTQFEVFLEQLDSREAW